MTTHPRILEVNARLGRYRILRELGRGGMGVVYLAHDDNLQRQVALKTTQVASIGASEQMRNQRRHRFIREVKALAQLSHENVVHVYDAGEEDHPDLGWILFYTMQFVEGITLAELVIQHGAIEPSAAAAICAQIASGLGAGHANGIIHRDVKPANVFLSEEGRALIGDFGIAKLADATQITRRDQMVGTPNYLAPEQILGGETTAATDVFALGALFYMITMRRPLRTKVDAASLIQHARVNVAHGKMLSALTVPRDLRNVVARALERDPAKRYPDGNAFAEALADFATRVPALREPSSSSELDESAFRAQFRTVDTDTFSAPLDVVGEEQDGFEAGSVVSTQITSTKPADTAGKSNAALSSLQHAPARKGKTAHTESTAVFNIRNLSLPEEMDFSGMDEELPNLVPIRTLDPQRKTELSAGLTEGDELYLLRSALAFLQNQIAEEPIIPVHARMPLPPAVENYDIAPGHTDMPLAEQPSAWGFPSAGEVSFQPLPTTLVSTEPLGGKTDARVKRLESDEEPLTFSPQELESVEAFASSSATEHSIPVSFSDNDLSDDAVFDSPAAKPSPGWLSRIASRWRTPKN